MNQTPDPNPNWTKAEEILDDHPTFMVEVVHDELEALA